LVDQLKDRYPSLMARWWLLVPAIVFAAFWWLQQFDQGQWFWRALVG
jgi:hypothetical protein